MIIVQTHKDNSDEFERFLKAQGVGFKRRKVLTHYFDVDIQSDNEVLKHSAVKKFTNSDNIIGGPAQTINMNGTLPFNQFNPTNPPWHILHLLRRHPYGDSPKADVNVNYTVTPKRTGQGVDVYVMDTSIFHNTPELGGRSYNLDGSQTLHYLFNNAQTDEDFYSDPVAHHGTSVSGLVGGNTNGLARGATLWNVPIMGYSGVFLTWGILTAETWLSGVESVIAHYQSRADTDRPAVVNMSIGVNEFTAASIDFDLITEMSSIGLVPVIAAGNNIRDMDLEGINYFPAETYGQNVVVGATDFRRQLFNRVDLGLHEFGSNSGSYVDIYAPGEAIITKSVNYTGSPIDWHFSGTSWACPLTAGVIACMLEGYSRLTNAHQVLAVKSKLLENATKGVVYAPESFNANLVHNNYSYLDPKIEYEDIPLCTRKIP